MSRALNRAQGTKTRCKASPCRIKEISELPNLNEKFFGRIFVLGERNQKRPDESTMYVRTNQNQEMAKALGTKHKVPAQPCG
jgi:hypothetical protein